MSVWQIRERKSPFIHITNAAKPGVVCAPFHTISYYTGCPYACAYCFLQTTFRGRVSPTVYTNRERLLFELDRWLAQPGSLRLNAGELEDSLALDGVIPLSEDLVPKFAAQQRHKLLLVTKSANVDNLLRHDPNGQVILAFSVNAPEVSQRFESGTPDPIRRVQAAAKAQASGYVVFLRLDPMVPIDGWPEAYVTFIHRVYDIMQPDRWILGSLRYFRSLPVWAAKLGRDTSVFSYAGEFCREDGRRRVTLPFRAEMYASAFQAIRGYDPIVQIRLCKETRPLYSAMGVMPSGCCYLGTANGRSSAPVGSA